VSGPEENNINSSGDTLSSFESKYPKGLAALGLITTHSYGNYDGYSDKQIAEQYTKVREFAKKHKKRLWHSEMGNGGSGGDPLAGGAETATRIEVDMKELQPTAWTIWQVAGDGKTPEYSGQWGGVGVTYPCTPTGQNAKSKVLTMLLVLVLLSCCCSY